jgi:hypothetical protein
VLGGQLLSLANRSCSGRALSAFLSVLRESLRSEQDDLVGVVDSDRPRGKGGLVSSRLFCLASPQVRNFRCTSNRVSRWVTPRVSGWGTRGVTDLVGSRDAIMALVAVVAEDLELKQHVDGTVGGVLCSMPADATERIELVQPRGRRFVIDI